MQVCLYARVSTASQAENDLSIPDQLKQMRDWCRDQGHRVVLEYVEPGASAKSRADQDRNSGDHRPGDL